MYVTIYHALGMEGLACSGLSAYFPVASVGPGAPPSCYQIKISISEGPKESGIYEYSPCSFTAPIWHIGGLLWDQYLAYGLGWTD